MLGEDNVSPEVASDTDTLLDCIPHSEAPPEEPVSASVPLLCARLLGTDACCFNADGGRGGATMDPEAAEAGRGGLAGCRLAGFDAMDA